MPQPRPEFENPPEIFYSSREARRYTVSTRIQTIQRSMTLRALELLSLPKEQEQRSMSSSPDGAEVVAAPVNRSALLLDVGCGSGISGDVLTERGHCWFGVDISRDMLAIAKEAEVRAYFFDDDDGAADDSAEDAEALSGKRTRVDTSHVRWGPIHDSDDDSASDAEADAEAGGDGVVEGPRMVEVMHNDIGQGLPFRPGSFDGCVSVSVIQWLCHSSKKGEVPQRRLMSFFQSLYNALRRGAKAVLQFYPSTPEQVNMITKAAMRCGFSGGVVVDFPHSTKAKKYYLVLQAGQVAGGFVPPPGLTGEPEEADNGSSDEEGSDEEADESDDEEVGRSRARVAGRDRERVKRNRAASARGGRRSGRGDARPATGTREWVLQKKEERRRRGYKATADSKYTMRQRRPKF